MGKEDTVANRRLAFSRLTHQIQQLQISCLLKISVNSKNRKGGYTSNYKSWF